ncbi:hypothetical protein [Nocardioides sp.]|uniref:hypothetical protein n=1 Tax=Nocardioides sp. TaxID=35761 RepID=UPI003527D3E5
MHAMLVADGWDVNVKRVERLWRREGLRVPPARSKQSGQKAIGADAHALWNLPSTHQGHVWSYDFMSLRTARGTGLRILNVVDEFTRVCVGSHVVVLHRHHRGAPGAGGRLRPLRPPEADPLRQRPGVHRHRAAGMAARPGCDPWIQVQSIPTAERLHQRPNG